MKIGIRQPNTPLKRFFIHYPFAINNHQIVNTIKDYKRTKNAAFFAFGGIEKNVLFSELNKYDFTFPAELINVWLQLGGGELFQEENILYPLPSENEILETLPNHIEITKNKGIDTDYQIFSTDLSNYYAFHKKTHEIAFFAEHKGKFVKSTQYKNIVEWFENLWCDHFNLKWIEVENPPKEYDPLKYFLTE